MLLPDISRMRVSSNCLRRRSFRFDGPCCLFELAIYAGIIFGCFSFTYLFYQLRERVIILKIVLPSDPPALPVPAEQSAEEPYELPPQEFKDEPPLKPPSDLEFTSEFRSTKSKSGNNRHVLWDDPASENDTNDCTRPARPSRFLNKLPLINLLSTQGSGQTWLRWLIERMTGICTGSLYADPKLFKAGFHCENYVSPGRHSRTIVVRSHYYHQLNASKVLLLVRNPYKGLVADFNRQTSAGNHTGLAAVISFYTLEWDDFVVVRTMEWLNLIQATLANATEVHVVFYENLKQSTDKELRTIARFLNANVTDERLNCTLHNAIGPARRPARFLPDDVFDDSKRRIINHAICTAYRELAAYGVFNFPDFYVESCNSMTKSWFTVN